MPEKKYLDYEGLEHYHKKVKESLSSGGGGSDLEKQIRENRRDIDLLFERSDLIANNLSRVDVSVLDGSNQPLQNYQIIGLKTKDGTGDVYTNEFGEATGYITAGSRTLQVKSPYIDVEPWSQSGTFVAGERYTYEAVLEWLDFVGLYSSGDIMFSPRVSHISFSVCGGGGGGSASTSYPYTGGGGGGGGYAKTGECDVEPNHIYPVSIGSGGSAGIENNLAASVYNYHSAGYSGGSTSFMGLIASGGNGGGNTANAANSGSASSTGGTGNGRGGAGGSASAGNGSAGTQYIYTSFSESTLCGGGGGGGIESGTKSSKQSTGGSPNGGNGAVFKSAEDGGGSFSTAGQTPGGGGGGGCGGNVTPGNSLRTTASNGGSGHVGIRINQ